MYKLIIILGVVIFTSCISQKFFIVRHAEKAGQSMTSDPPLTNEGNAQAKDLEIELHNQHIRNIFSTNTLRTKSTAAPLSELTGQPIQIYNAADQKFIVQLKSLKRGNVLVVGHSNTVDDIVNGMTGKKLMSDLPDSEYAFIYLVKRKGSQYSFQKYALPRRAAR